LSDIEEDASLVPLRNKQSIAITRLIELRNKKAMLWLLEMIPEAAAARVGKYSVHKFRRKIVNAIKN